MNSEKRNCQNCKKDFVIEPDDFSFYEKIKVPPPTFCPECRTIRRIQFRNERSLYHFSCKLCGKNGISMYNSKLTFPIYCVNCWYSDKWDSLDYGQDYNFSISFFEQFKILSEKVPRPNIFHRNIINGEYSNIVGDSKNLYLSYSINLSENIYYSKSVDKSKDIFDSLSAISCNLCSEITRGENNYNSNNLILCRNCMDSTFLFDCNDCQNCFLSFGLRNKKYVFKNIQYSEKEYKEKIEEIELNRHVNFKRFKEDFLNLIKISPHRYAQIIKSTNSTGDELENTKNSKYTFDSYNMEDTKYVFRNFGSKECYDGNNIANSELVYEFAGGGANNSYNLLFNSNGIKGLRNVFYTDFCVSSSNLFGCVSLNAKQYCILNKQYTKEEYEELLPKIIQHMNNMPYIDNSGLVYKYGEFFPSELSPFCYNETIAQEYFPSTKEETISKGYKWKDKDKRNYTIDIKNKDIPDNINDVEESIIGKVMECEHKGDCDEQCTEAFKIIEPEYQFYKKVNLPIPRLCPNCRHYQRLKHRNPLRLWHRKCMKEGCNNEFETSYSPDRPEIIYCEKCYQQEVY